MGQLWLIISSMKVIYRLVIVFAFWSLSISSAFAGESPEELFNRGVQTYNRFTDHDVEESIKHFKSAIEGDSSFSPAHAALAESYIQKYYRSGEDDRHLIKKASESAEKALMLDPRSPEAHKALGSVYFAKGKIEEAIEELERAVDMEPEFARAWLNLGTCHFELGRLGKAMEFFVKAAEIKNDPLAEGLAHFNIAYIQSNQKDYLPALNSYRKAEGLVPLYYNIHYGMGVALMNLERDKEAVSAFKKAVELKPDYADGWFGLASASHRLKDFKEAGKAYERTLDLDPDFDEARDGLRAL